MKPLGKKIQHSTRTLTERKKDKCYLTVYIFLSFNELSAICLLVFFSLS